MADELPDDQNDRDRQRDALVELSIRDELPPAHRDFLWRLKLEAGFEPRVVYDVGCCVLHWTQRAAEVWPGAQFVLFDAFEPAAFLYGPHLHHVGVLSSREREGQAVRWYQNDALPGGNSYYREAGMYGDHFPAHRYTERVCTTLDTVVREQGFPPPDLVKIDVQGAERDVIDGALRTLVHARCLIVEMQHVPYNEGAPLVGDTLPFIESLGWTCVARRFSDNGPDADYCFVRARAS